MKRYLVPIFLAFIIAGCTQAPDRLYHPKAIFKAEIKDNDVYYTFYVKGIVYNSNSERVFRDVKGEVRISSGKSVTVLPFEIPPLLPFQKYTLNVEKTGKENEMKPLLDLFRVDIDRLITGGYMNFSDEMDIPSGNFDFVIINYTTENIFDIIKKGRSDEN
ncbi:MAG TPA: hypothetical protein PK200_15720 [Spirochaetota bacterium]|nr:hypothetical protein [Spirochaetota bacterium]HQO00634.1 hypothetical protein [Spirochaetota bacterium]HQP49298.1 hypothetical protein [Spirochaetota bacterium]